MIQVGDATRLIGELPAEHFQTCITSPPYFGLRDYEISGQIGLEPTPAEYVDQLRPIFAGIWRALKKDGTLWLNMGDSYNAYNGNAGPGSGEFGNRRYRARPKLKSGYGLLTKSLKEKQMLGMPWRVAFMLQEAGWYLRADIIWHKPNAMPECVKDRPTKAHEYVFLLAKQPRYFYDARAIMEPAKARNEHDFTGQGYKAPGQALQRGSRKPSGWDAGPGNHRKLVGRYPQKKQDGYGRRHEGFNDRYFSGPMPVWRNKRSVWEINTQAFPGAHFATFPEKLVEPCILAGSRPGDAVLDPFCGSGTVGVVCARLGREFTGIELKPEYAAMAEARLIKALAQGHLKFMEGR